MATNYQDPECTVFVSNIESRVTEELLWELFLQAGPLKNVHIPIDRSSGKSKTFAFVTYSDISAVAFSCELFNTLKLFNRPIYCKPSKDGKAPVKSISNDHSPIITPHKPGQPQLNESLMNNSWVDDRSPPSGRREYSSRESHVDHQRNNFDYRNSPHEVRSNGHSNRYDRDNDLSPYDYQGGRRGENRNLSDPFSRTYDDSRRIESLTYRHEGYDRNERSSNQQSSVFQLVSNSIDQLRRESSFGNSPLRYGPQRDDLIPRHRASRKQNTRPY
ncbi:RNA-binding protein 7 isoform X1 [Hydra vulgaris]|uniref:RNA-binding protein 7 n=1 Tax=Hydra vulgaris TaxID=6087 RepID=T2M261_HYDVU|nr:RNA-binding protein 7 [Hydra vulgaris]